MVLLKIAVFLYKQGHKPTLWSRDFQIFSENVKKLICVIGRRDAIKCAVEIRPLHEIRYYHFIDVFVAFVHLLQILELHNKKKTRKMQRIYYLILWNLLIAHFNTIRFEYFYNIYTFRVCKYSVFKLEHWDYAVYKHVYNVESTT